VLSVGDRVPDDILEKDLEYAPRFFVDETRNTLDTTTTSETANGWLVVTINTISFFDVGIKRSWELLGSMTQKLIYRFVKDQCP